MSCKKAIWVVRLCHWKLGSLKKSIDCFSGKIDLVERECVRVHGTLRFRCLTRRKKKKATALATARGGDGGDWFAARDELTGRQLRSRTAERTGRIITKELKGRRTGMTRLCTSECFYLRQHVSSTAQSVGLLLLPSSDTCQQQWLPVCLAKRSQWQW